MIRLFASISYATSDFLFPKTIIHTALLLGNKIALINSEDTDTSIYKLNSCKKNTCLYKRP